MHLHGRDFRDAIAWLETHVALSPTTPIPSTQAALQLPPADPAKRAQVEAYLCGQRALPAALVQTLFHSGALYADGRANAVFHLQGPQQQLVGAELRGTTAVAWRGMAPGSRKDYGYFAAPPPPTARAVVLCESAIDALSCAVLHPKYTCLSTAGARPDPRWLGPLLHQRLPVYCGFDADATGETLAQEMMRRHPTVQRLRPTLHDWNDVLRAQH